jgi:hypothetical protein
MDASDLILGLRYGMSNEDYHAHPAIGSTSLKRMARTPLHFRHGPKVSQTAAMKAGTLAHCALLERDSLAERYIVKPEGIDGRTKAGKEWAASIPVGVEVVDAEDMAKALAQAESVRRLPDVAALLGSGAAEVSAFWIDEATGLHCKVRPDYVHTTPAGVILFDLKTCQDASPAGFAKDCAKYGYHIQAGMYSEGYERASGLPVLGFVFGAVEGEQPYAAAPYMLDDEAAEKGRNEFRRLLNLYAECKAADTWPGYSESISLINLPAWA